MEDMIKLGVSSCLLGEKVRYDGGHKLDQHLKELLGRYVEWVPVCPEVEMGLTVPREPMRLVGDAVSSRLVTTSSGIDHTDWMIQWANKKLRTLSSMDLRGFIFKSKSPSCRMRSVEVYDAFDVQSKTGIGLFAREFMARFPLLPVEDDVRLQDSSICENFMEIVIAGLKK
jgi:uncharacterized protein YbbK (DUF523 family)